MASNTSKLGANKYYWTLSAAQQGVHSTDTPQTTHEKLADNMWSVNNRSGAYLATLCADYMA